MVILLAIFAAFLLCTRRQRFTWPQALFVIFSLFYFARISLESISGNNLFMPPMGFFFYFMSFVFLPLVLLSRISFNQHHYKHVFLSMLVGCVATSLLTAYFYNDYVGEVSRISSEVSRDENYISPLSLSYVSVLGIGLALAYLITNKVSLRSSLFLGLVVLVGLVPFFLGASRGSIIALVFPFVVFMFSSKGVSKKFSAVGILVAAALLLALATLFFGTGVFDRFFGIANAVEQGSSSAVRLHIWKNDFVRFMDSPIFGFSLQSEYVKTYPHNIFIESLIATGMLGTIPFLCFLMAVFYKSIKIIRASPKDFWVVILFYIGFAQNMFSGAIWSASFLAIGASLILGYRFNFVGDRNMLHRPAVAIK